MATPCPSLRKFREWVDHLGSQTVAARVLDVSIPTVNLIMNGKRKPSRVLAGRIFTRSRGWKKGPIAMSGWGA